MRRSTKTLPVVIGTVALVICGAASSAARTPTVRPCRDGQVELKRPAQVGGILGTTIIPVVLRNVSRVPCTLRGYAAVRLFGPGLRPISPLVVVHGEAGPKEPKRVQTDLLVPGHRSAEFDLSFVDHPSPTPAADCRRIAAVAARLPGQSDWLKTRLAIEPTDCTGKPLSVSVSPIGV